MMHDINGFQRDCLYVVGGLGDPQGTAIKEALDEYYGTDINAARLYPSLDTLAERGLVEKGEKDGRTNRYTLTPRGRRVLSDRRAWEDRHVGDLIGDRPAPTP